MSALLRGDIPEFYAPDSIPVITSEKARAVFGYLGAVTFHGLELMGRGIGAVEDTLNSFQETVFNAAEQYIAAQAADLDTAPTDYRPRQLGGYEYVNVETTNTCRSIIFGRKGLVSHKLVHVVVGNRDAEDKIPSVRAFEVNRTEDPETDLENVAKTYGSDKRSGLSLFKVGRAIRAAKRSQKHKI